MNDEELEKLTQKHLDERLTEEEFKRLESFLQDSSYARRRYIESARMDSALQEAHYEQVPNSLIEKRSVQQSVSKYFGVYWTWGGVTAFVGVFSLLLFMFLPKSNKPEPESHDSGAHVQSVAVITAQAGVEWENKNFREGTSLKPGTIKLLNGIAQVDFYSGAAISLSGPAKFELINEDKAVLHYGKIKAHVPPAARGFEIKAKEVLLEDLGTSFGLEVNKETGIADLLVFDGEVRLTGKSGNTLLLTDGLAANLTNGEPVKQKPFNPERFPEVSDVVRASASTETLRYLEWKESCIRIAKDPRLIAYFDFEDLTNSSRRLRNRAVNGLGSEYD
ncbi:MAG: hypothetical protein HN548_03555, partial [Opitutae bacterium]|nr:hypothetical protein [Opitutae bacterium]